jgi:hypothetical protein
VVKSSNGEELITVMVDIVAGYAMSILRQSLLGCICTNLIILSKNTRTLTKSGGQKNFAHPKLITPALV